MEKLLHYAWKYKMFPLKPLVTTDGRSLEIVDPGVLNHDAGPDFFNAKIKLGGIEWAGNIELHLKSSDWYTHHHDTDPCYNNVILHVAEDVNRGICTEDGKVVPQLQLNLPNQVRYNYEELKRTVDYPRCYRIIPNIDSFIVHSWMNILLYERIEQRAQRIAERLAHFNGDWERTFFVTLSRNFGFGINGDAFEEWARYIPLSAVSHHRDNLFQVEAIFMGQAGLLDESTIPSKYLEEAFSDGYFMKLKKEYNYLAKKFTLKPMAACHWNFLRLRPQNFPHIRIAQIAQLYFMHTADFSRILEAKSIEEIHGLLVTHVTPYWESHYTFGCPSYRTQKTLTQNSLNLIIINTIVPILYAYGKAHGQNRYCELAIALLESIKAENNYITRQWESCGIKVHSATDSQALIQLKKEYCDKRYCLHCRFGYEFLKNYRP